MLLSLMLVLCGGLSEVYGQPGRCDQTPNSTVAAPTDGFKSPFYLDIVTKTESEYSKTFSQGQTYVVVLEARNSTQHFKEFMVTVEDPTVDDNIYQFNHQDVDVGTLKTLHNDPHSMYSERCYNTVQNRGLSDKTRITLHWVSPKKQKRVRFRATVVENKETWYTGGHLNFTMEKDDQKADDTVPIEANKNCRVCSEAQYEVVFKGMWSRGTHSLHYPEHPDDNKYSHMVGASHGIDFTLWKENQPASYELRDVAERADITSMERQIISNMTKEPVSASTRSLIRGTMHKHPHMSDPSHSLFRVDRVHHLFSLVVAIKPSPDWFLGTNMFELCTFENKWLESHVMPLFPWDAGSRDGISYEGSITKVVGNSGQRGYNHYVLRDGTVIVKKIGELYERLGNYHSPTTATTPMESVDRVALGSFDKESPFYQMNLNDLKPFAMLEVRKLEEYPLADCDPETDYPGPNANDEDEAPQAASPSENEETEESVEDPQAAESRLGDDCPPPGEWSACLPDNGVCGLGVQTRTRSWKIMDAEADDLQVRPLASCREDLDVQTCFITCY